MTRRTEKGMQVRESSETVAVSFNFQLGPGFDLLEVHGALTPVAKKHGFRDAGRLNRDHQCNARHTCVDGVHKDLLRTAVIEHLEIGGL